eukprot:scaffold152226_cov41-Attheya_sp.AAC.1
MSRGLQYGRDMQSRSLVRYFYVNMYEVECSFPFPYNIGSPLAAAVFRGILITFADATAGPHNNSLRSHLKEDSLDRLSRECRHCY